MSDSIIATSMQLDHTGGLDKHITGNPETSLFTYDYKQTTPYAKHTTTINFNEKVDWGRTISATVPSFGDLLNTVYLHFVLPPLAVPAGSTYVGYTQAIGYAMIDYVELRIAEQIVAHHSGRSLEIMDYMSTKSEKTLANYKSIGRYDTVNVLQQNAMAPQPIYIPLQFWFNKGMDMSLPLITLSGQTVKIFVKLRPFESLVIFDGPVAPQAIPLIDGVVIADYVLLSETEKLDFKELPQEYLIEERQENILEITKGTTTNKYGLEFTKCVKEILFVLCEVESEENNDFFNYGRRSEALRGGEFITSISLLFDGRVRMERLPESYFRLITPQRYHTFAGNRNIYCISFSDKPEENQPSGTVNFSRYDNIDLVLDFVRDVPQCRLHVVAVSYNRLVIMPDGTVHVEYLT